jgi:hypothetical protein
MLRKMMLAGLMTATVLGGIAPAYAQRGEDGGGWRGRGGEQRSGGERPAQNPAQNNGSERQQRAWERGGDNRQQQAQRWEQRQQQQRPAPVEQARPQPQSQAQWRGNDGRPDRGTPAPAARDNRERQRWNQNRGGNDGSGVGRAWSSPRNDDRRAENRWDGRGRDDRKNDRRWNNDDRRGNWNNNWNNGRRFDDRTRWEGQRRWDNGWRNDRRYDWSSYRSRYGDRYRLGRYYAPRGWSYGYSRFSIGIFLNSLLYSNSYWIDDPYSYRLPPAYGTLRWVRYYDDALLVDIRDGYVVDVIHDFFW